MGGDGRVRTDGQTPDGWTPHGWTADGWTLDGWTAHGRPPDLWTTTPGDRTPDSWTAGSRTPKPDGWTPHAGHRRPTPWRACWQGRPRRRRLSSRYRLDAPPGRRRLGEQQPGPLSRKDAGGTHAGTDGSGHRRDSQLQVVRRRPAGALAHCCRVLDLDGTRGGQRDYGKVRGCGVRLVRACGWGCSLGAEVAWWSAYVQVDAGEELWMGCGRQR